MPGTMNMTLSEIIPVWADLNQQIQNALLASAQERRVDKGTIVHNGKTECTGLILVEDGQLRAYSLSPDGREITLYRLLERDVCLFSASCMLRGIQFDITIEAEQDTRFWIVPAEVYQRAMTQSIELSNYTNQLMAERLSDVMWLLEKVLWQSFDRRLAEFLLEESNLAGSDELSITHETIARHLGTAREVVSRMLKYFKSEELITLTRGTVRILDRERLEALSEG